MDNNEEKQLGPRFTIKKSRIGEGQNKTGDSEEFAPEKVIYIEIDDEITNVFDKLKRLKMKRIALVIPRRAILLQSIINLKILKKKIADLEKEIIIVTADPAGMQMVEKAGIPATPKLFSKETTSAKTQPPQQKNERPLRFSTEKVSLSEIIRHEKQGFFEKILSRAKEQFKKKKPHSSADKDTKLVFVAPNKQALFTLILVSVLLLLTIAYIALPGATIYLTPKSSVLDVSFNVSFLDFEKNRILFENNTGNNISIPSYPVKPPQFTKKIIHYATGKNFQGENARGTITITNLSNAPWELSAQTRFQTENGIVFRIPNAIRVPAARESIPGMMEAAVIADPFDANSQVVGERGNIQPSKLFLPGLKTAESRKKLFAENRSAITGGTTKTVKMIRKEDIDAATQEIKKQIAVSAPEELKKYLEQQNLANKTNFSLLTDRRILKTGEPEISMPPGIVGQAADQFEATAAYYASSIAFDRQELLNVLKERMAARADPDKKISRVSEDDISYKFLDEDPAAGKVRLTVTLRAIQVFELDPDKENGRRFIKKLTDHIAGMRIKEAEEYLQQQTDEIAKAEIKLWPIWAPTIPNIADNIEFAVREEENDLR